MVMKMTTQANDATGWYTNVLKGWHDKQLGRKPTVAELNAIHALGARPGKQAIAAAMALRPCGVTGSQVVMTCGAPQLNKMRGFVADGLAKWVPTPPAANGHKVYRLELTAKGNGRVKAAATNAAQGKPADKGGLVVERKPRKAAVKPAKPVNEPAATVTLPAPVNGMGEAPSAN